jgi:hypothetical protein
MNSPHVIVIIDEDAALCALLREVLVSSERIVDVVDHVSGITPELIALSQPTLVILNPRAGGLSSSDLKALIADVRALTGARFVLLVGHEAEDHATELVSSVGASGAVPVRTLLRDPLKALALEPAPVVAPSGLRGLDSLGVDDILDLQLDDTTPQAPMTSTPSQVARLAAPVAALEALITDELSRASSESGLRSVRFNVVLDVTSDASLVANERGEIVGLYVATLFPPPLGVRTQVQVDFPWGERLNLQGIVAFEDSGSPFRSKRKPGIGVKLDASESFARAADRFAALRVPMKHAL